MIRKVVGLHFSPRGGTAKITERIAKDIAEDLDAYMANDVEFECVEMQDAIDRQLAVNDETVVVIGMPVHIGKIPLPAIKLLREINGAGAMTVALVSYGAATYGNALYELFTYADELNYTVIGAGAFIAEHGYRKKSHLVRPDLEDIESMEKFSKAVANKVKRLAGSDVEGMKIKPAPLMLGGKMPVHKISKFWPRGAELAELGFEKSNIIRRSPEWFL